MNEMRASDEMIRETFDRRASRVAPVGLRDSILRTTASTRQRGTTRRALVAGSRLRLLAAAALLAVGLTAGVIYAGSRPVDDERPTKPAPTAIAPGTAFNRWFSYEPDPRLSLPTTTDPDLSIVFAFRVEEEPRRASGDGIVRPVAKGITVSTTRGAVAHPCDEVTRRPLREDPVGFLDDLRTVAGAEIGPLEHVTFDGRPATSAFVHPPTGWCLPHRPDFHPKNSVSQFVRLEIPSRVILTEVDGQTFVIQVWAGTETDLQEWLASSAGFVDSIHFTGGESLDP